MSQEEIPMPPSQQGNIPWRKLEEGEMAIIGILGVLLLIGAGIFLCYNSYNQREAEKEKAKSEAIKTMVDSGKSTTEILQMMEHWYPPPPPPPQVNVGEKRAELIKHLQNKTYWTSSEITKVAESCYKEEDFQAAKQAKEPPKVEQPKGLAK